ncbi:MAG: RNA 2',3'-cyclic phosphodiesterase [Methanobrevibacter sp.]|jgi:2'-5' RNA ligase|nr:RNA 2',3'-cyclic phosphodiesterase [Candidatus Methanovirga aequatorialis]
MMDDSKLRTFLAIDVDESLMDKILDVQKKFTSTKANIKYVPKENLHFTLKFFGDVDRVMISKISELVKETLHDFKPIELYVNGLGTFPNEEHVKVIWIGVSENNDFLNLLNTLDDKFKGLGFKKEKSYKFHLTIGRMKNSKNKKEVKNVVNECKDFEVGTMKISKLSLKKSELTPSGPIYSDLKTFKFNQG